jgi:tetratricopeptide (TPR) repeat protein
MKFGGKLWWKNRTSDCILLAILCCSQSGCATNTSVDREQGQPAATSTADPAHAEPTVPAANETKEVITTDAANMLAEKSVIKKPEPAPVSFPSLSLPRLSASQNTAPISEGNNPTPTAASTGDTGQSATDKTRMANRLAAADDDLFFVDKLLHTSSAAKQIKASGRQDALDLHVKATDFYKQALRAREAGDKKAQAYALSQAKLTLFSALRLLPKEQSVSAHQKLEFQRRSDTITALMDAQQRIRREKLPGAGTPQTDGTAAVDYLKAQQAFTNGDYAKAIELADKTLLDLKQSLIRLRNGDTLVRSLTFVTPQDEYKYEIDRNDTHQMLVSILLKDKLDDTDTMQRVNQNLEKAREIRSQAEQQAQQGDYETAIKTLELSTQQIVRAIRAAGVYIPG